jgi:hypothetical protein
MPVTRSLRRGVDLRRPPEDDVQMRFPRASAVIVALSTFVAVVTISALASQLVPFDRAGAVLPDGPITIDAPSPDESPLDETSPPSTDPTSTSTPGAGVDSAPGASGDEATVVVPAPAETVEPEPTPGGPPAEPGNSGNAPGLSGSAGNGGTPPGQGKP